MSVPWPPITPTPTEPFPSPLPPRGPGWQVADAVVDAVMSQDHSALDGYHRRTRRAA